MITSLLLSLLRVTLFWYVCGALVLFLGHPDWAETLYARLSAYPWIPVLEMKGLSTAAEVQLHLVLYWTIPMLCLWALALMLGIGVAELRYQMEHHRNQQKVKVAGSFWGVHIPAYSLGALPRATTPALTGARPYFAGISTPSKDGVVVDVRGTMATALRMLDPAELAVCEELLQLLLARPEHYAGLGHGVGLLQHTLNVAAEAAKACTPEFRLPLLAAFSHDVGKLLTFQQGSDGTWIRKGLHSRESARILVTLPAFEQLPELHRDALLLAIKYDHAPSKMPSLRGSSEPSRLALRIINALGQADRTATADEKERHLERLKPEDILWKDFVDFLREAPVVQRGKKGADNQVNNPTGPYLFIYEAAWREAAIARLPPEVAAALDLTRRDPGKLAKYTRILAQRLRDEGLLVEQAERELKDENGQTSKQELKVSEGNPLWDVQSGVGEKALVMRGVLVLHSAQLWLKLNYRLSVVSPFPVSLVAPNASPDGNINPAPKADRSVPLAPETTEGVAVDVAQLGLLTEGPAEGSSPKSRKPARRRVEPQPKEPVRVVAGLEDALQAPDASAPGQSATPAAMDVLPEPGAPSDAPAEMDASTAAALSFITGAQATPTPEEPMVVSPSGDAEPVVAPEPVVVPESAVTGPAENTPPAELERKLSRAERREGLALADEEACARFPGLALGDKYYTRHAALVKSGRLEEGSPYGSKARAAQQAGLDAPEVALDRTGATEPSPPVMAAAPPAEVPGMATTARPAPKKAPRRNVNRK